MSVGRSSEEDGNKRTGDNDEETLTHAISRGLEVKEAGVGEGEEGSSAAGEGDQIASVLRVEEGGGEDEEGDDVEAGFDEGTEHDVEGTEDGKERVDAGKEDGGEDHEGGERSNGRAEEDEEVGQGHVEGDPKRR